MPTVGTQASFINCGIPGVQPSKGVEENLIATIRPLIDRISLFRDIRIGWNSSLDIIAVVETQCLQVFCHPCLCADDNCLINIPVNVSDGLCNVDKRDYDKSYVQQE